MALPENLGAARSRPRITLENPTLNHLVDALRDLALWFAHEQIGYVLTGPVAEAVLWRPRLSRHIDVLCVLSEVQLLSKLASSSAFGLAQESGGQGADAALTLRHVTSYACVRIRTSTSEAELRAAQRALDVDLNGVVLKVLTPEDYVVLMARAGAADEEDLDAILKTYPHADRAYLLRYLLPEAPETSGARLAAKLREKAPQTNFAPAPALVRM